jgi:molecular chaperone GrpE
MKKHNTKIDNEEKTEEIKELNQEENQTCKNYDKLIEEKDNYLNNWKRSQADYENLKKQTEKRIRDIIEFGNAEMILDFLPLYNYYKTALEHIPEEFKKESWLEGLSHIDSLWQGIFLKFGIKKINTVGEQFDHNIHEAIDFEKDESKKDHEILKEVSAGYELNGKAIQPARVIVNKIH